MTEKGREAPKAVVPLPPGGLAWERLLDLVAPSGVRLRAAIWNGGGPRGLALILPGRTEFLEKMTLPAAALAEQGFAVASLDWRGQGMSDRLLPEPLKGHIDDFASYVADLEALLAAPEMQTLGPPRVLLGHSMGGAIALGAIRRGSVAPEALILSAPMFGIEWTRPVAFALRAMVAIARPLGLFDRWPLMFRPDVPYVLTGFPRNVLTASRQNFEWVAGAMRIEPRLALATPTLGWLDAAEREMAANRAWEGALPPTLCLLGSDERVVEGARVRAFAADQGAEFVEFDGARHDLLLETPAMQAPIWEAVGGFLARHLPDGSGEG